MGDADAQVALMERNEYGGRAVDAVFGLTPDPRAGATQDLSGDLVAPSDRQTVHEESLGCRSSHQLDGHLVRHQGDPHGPLFALGGAGQAPRAYVNSVDSTDGFVGVVRGRDVGAGARRDRPGTVDHVGIGFTAPWCHDSKVGETRREIEQVNEVARREIRYTEKILQHKVLLKSDPSGVGRCRWLLQRVASWGIEATHSTPSGGACKRENLVG
jgi:hypothetical protein